jgi:DNA mismatch repair protein MutL
LFAQNRWIQDRGLQAAVMEAYRNLLMHGEFPIAAAWVETDPSQIDVNIHPSKSQVKFLDPSLAFRAVQASVRDTLEQAPWIEKSSNSAVYSSVATFSNNYLASAPEVLKFSDGEFNRVQFKQKTSLTEVAPAPTTEVEPNSSTTGYWSSLQVLGQADLTYIICQDEKSVVFVDQHAAHERVLFEKLMSAWQGKKSEIQEFLFPIAIDLSLEKVEAVLKCKADLQRLGLDIESLGPSTLGLRSAPSGMKESALASSIEKMAQEILDHGGSYQIEKLIGDLCASMACHSAIRAGQAQSLEQMKALLSEMDAFPLSSFCPHGRPVSVEYPFVKLQRDFGRLV